MKKVVYSVTKSGRYDDFPMKGIGYITDNDLLIPCLSRNQKPYIRVFEDCLKNCHPILGRQDEFKGSHYEIRDVEFTRNDGSKETRECEFDYNIWYKYAD